MEWTDCPLIEAVPGRLSGVPVLRDSRVRPDDLIDNIEEGPLAQVEGVLAFYHQHLSQLARTA